MRQNWKIHIKFGVFKSKRLEWVWRVLVWEKIKNFIQQEATKKEKSDIKTYQNVQIYYERVTSSGDFHEVQRLPWSPDDFQEVQTTEMEVVWKTSWKSSSALYFRRLTCKSVQKSSRSEKTCISNPDLKNLHIQKRSNDLKTEKMSGRLDKSTFIEHTKIHI